MATPKLEPTAASTPITPAPATVVSPTLESGQGEEFVPPNGLPTTGEDFVPPNMLPVTGEDTLIPTRLPNTGLGFILPMGGFGLAVLAFVIRYLRSSGRNRD
jgi:hypothetical protein